MTDAKDGGRGILFYYELHFIRHRTPKAFLLENVEETWDAWLNDLRRDGLYNVHCSRRSTGIRRSPVAEMVRAAHNVRGPTYASTTADINRRSCHTDVPLPNERRLYNDLSGDVRPISFCYSTFAWWPLVLH